MPSLNLSHENIEPDIGCIRLAGRLDIIGVQEVELRFTALTCAMRKPVIIDMTLVELITSLGLGMLISSANALRAVGKPMILIRPQPNVEKVLRMACLDDLLPVEHDLDSALERIKKLIKRL